MMYIFLVIAHIQCSIYQYIHITYNVMYIAHQAAVTVAIFPVHPVGLPQLLFGITVN